MKAIILAGGLGTRLSEETSVKPKPMVEIGGRPILWHVMKIYAAHGVNDFVICCGYKGYVIKEYFANYALHNSDMTIDLSSGEMVFHRRWAEPWRVTLVDTGEESMTGGRLLRTADHVRDEKEFFFTYGDGLGDVDITASLAFHREHGRQATLTAAYPPGRFGALGIHDKVVTNFEEKPKGDGSMINGGFFVLSPKVIERIADDLTVWEQEPLRGLASDGELMAYEHRGFWQPMDTLRDKHMLEGLWASGKAPWKVWA
ncbi:Glucose-1-phosphate cytidylyltransferase [Methylobacterium bullatum]|uniref:Glucose-1-phosphate cytidylyltransferase n=1 Tax=Methylobacterium bullatum TaxID=570505 RepID=A0A679J9V0_9HYPH|nr:Glucose-1-phosphate cytidylyltransferase [Methylobacterium bullatum]